MGKATGWNAHCQRMRRPDILNRWLCQEHDSSCHSAAEGSATRRQARVVVLLSVRPLFMIANLKGCLMTSFHCEIVHTTMCRSLRSSHPSLSAKATLRTIMRRPATLSQPWKVRLTFVTISLVKSSPHVLPSSRMDICEAEMATPTEGGWRQKPRNRANSSGLQ